MRPDFFRPCCGQFADTVFLARHSGQQKPGGAVAFHKGLCRLLERLHQPRRFSGARSRQQKNGLRLAIGRKRAFRALLPYGEYIGVDAEAMTDKGRRRAAETAHGFRLEGQQGQNVIDIGQHRGGAIFLPGPDAGADIIDNRQMRQLPADLFRNAMGEIRAVDDQQNIGLRSRDGLRGLVDPRNELRQLFQDLREAHDGEFGIIEQRHQPLRFQRLTTDTHQLNRTGIPGLERADQIRAEKITGYLAGDNRHF
ncbi:hypothetical protein D3C80_1108610 [compost metagenome]